MAEAFFAQGLDAWEAFIATSQVRLNSSFTARVGLFGELTDEGAFVPLTQRMAGSTLSSNQLGVRRRDVSTT